MITFTAFCPHDEFCGELVEAHDAGFTATTIEVDACPTLAAQGILSSNWRKSSVVEVPTPEYRHKDGLVIFG